MKKKTIIMYVFGDITTDARVQRAANALSRDYDVTVLSHDKGKKVEDGAFRNVLLKGWDIHPFLTTVGTVWNAYKYIKANRPDIVYAHDYYSTMLCRLLSSHKYCGKLIYDAHELIIPEKGKPMPFRERLYYKQEKRIVSKVDMLVCASEERGRMMQSHYGLASMPLVVDNISQLSVSDDETTADLLRSLSDFFSKPGITVVYAGAVSRGRKIDMLLEAVKSLAPEFKLLIVGNGPVLPELKQKATAAPELVTAFTGAVPYKCLGAILKRCDIGFLYYPVDTLNNTYCASNKIYEYASVGLPMLANENPTVKRILEQSQIGLSTNNFADGLQRIAVDTDSYKQNCNSFTQHNQWEEEAELLRQTVNQL